MNDLTLLTLKQAAETAYEIARHNDKLAFKAKADFDDDSEREFNFLAAVYHRVSDIFQHAKENGRFSCCRDQWTFECGCQVKGMDLNPLGPVWIKCAVHATPDPLRPLEMVSHVAAVGDFQIEYEIDSEARPIMRFKSVTRLTFPA